MNNFIKKFSKMVILLSCLIMMIMAVALVIPVTTSQVGYLKVAALDGYDKGIRGFELPKEQTQPITVKAVEEKQPLQFDTTRIVFIGLIGIGILASAGLILYWLKIAK